MPDPSILRASLFLRMISWLPRTWRERAELTFDQHYGAAARAERDEAARRFGLLFERSSEGLLICGRDGQILACNGAAARLFALPSDALCGSALLSHLVQPINPGDEPRLRGGEARARRSDGGLVPVELCISEFGARAGEAGLV
jgi:PAS domain-containing protein